MSERLDFYAASPEALKAQLGVEAAIAKMGLEAPLLELIRLRASQINGCAFCVDMHTTDARKAGESERRLHAVVAWRETPFFSGRERAALAWTEALTLLASSHAPDADFAQMKERFSEREIVNVTLAINSINSWNRMAVGFRKVPVL